MSVERHFCAVGVFAVLLASGGASLAAPSPPMQIKLAGGPGGDAAGSGVATVTVDPAVPQACYNVSTSLTNATMAHIHKGAAGASGPVAVPFKNPTDGKTQGCAAVSQELANDLLAHPADYYVNVHTPQFPMGAIRGQLK
jgi:hypothetical protein